VEQQELAVLYSKAWEELDPDAIAAPFTCDGVDVVTVADGLVARKETYLDFVAYRRQAGPLPASLAGHEIDRSIRAT
jgi:hypothetical protein